MGWILRRGISCCRCAREDCHLVLHGLDMLALNHWERMVLVQKAMLGRFAWRSIVVLKKTLLLLVGREIDFGELPCPRL